MAENESFFTALEKHTAKGLVGVFLFARFVSLIAMPYDGLRLYGDFVNYFAVSSLPGLPFIHYWVEYPPFFPFLLELLNRISGGREHVFTYLVVFLLTLADAANLFLLFRAAGRLWKNDQAVLRAVAYLLVLAVLPYGWWYFDPIAVFWTLLSLNLVLERRWVFAGLAAGMGIVTKFFPGLVLVAAWRRATWKQLVLLGALSLLPLILSYGVLWLSSPEFTLASLQSQSGKGSWETTWALLDGNIHTGVFGPFEERLDPGTSNRLLGNPAVIPPAASLFVFAGAGLAGLLRVRNPEKIQAASLVGFAWTLFLLWSPGWSPQWVLYLLPLILLTLPFRQALLFGVTLMMTSLLEWPVLLSRGMFQFMWVPILLRTLVLVFLCYSWVRIALLSRVDEERASAST